MKKVRALPEFQKLPIIVFSNTYLTNMVQEAWKAGATKCLSKANCTPKQLIEVVRNSVARNGVATASTPAPQTEATVAAAPATVPQPSPTAAQAAPDSSASQANLRKEFLQNLPATFTTLRALLQTLIKTEDEPGRTKHIHEMYRRIHALTSN